MNNNVLPLIAFNNDVAFRLGTPPPSRSVPCSGQLLPVPLGVAAVGFVTSVYFAMRCDRLCSHVFGQCFSIAFRFSCDKIGLEYVVVVSLVQRVVVGSTSKRVGTLFSYSHGHHVDEIMLEHSV